MEREIETLVSGICWAITWIVTAIFGALGILGLLSRFGFELHYEKCIWVKTLATYACAVFPSPGLVQAHKLTAYWSVWAIIAILVILLAQTESGARDRQCRYDLALGVEDRGRGAGQTLRALLDIQGEAPDGDGPQVLEELVAVDDRGVGETGQPAGPYEVLIEALAHP